MTQANSPHPLPASVARELAVAASVDPRTLHRYLAGRPIAPMCVARIERALREKNLAYLVSTTSLPPSAA